MDLQDSSEVYKTQKKTGSSKLNLKPPAYSLSIQFLILA